MATVYIHIGAPKTATSTLQSALAKGAGALLKAGVLYPSELRHGDAHHLLVCDLIEKYQKQKMPDLWYGDCPRREAWSALSREIASHGDKIQSVILSSELFFGQTRNIDLILKDVQAHLQGHQVKVVVYLRRQDQLYSSFFNQDVKGVRQWSYSAYQFYQTHQIFRHDYHQLITTWKQNILIRPYEPQQWEGEDIVQDFCQLVGIPPLASTKVRHNESLGINQVYIKGCLNRVGFDKSANEQVLQKLLELCPEEPAKDTLYINKRLYRSYRQEWQDVNKAMAKDFLQGRPLFEQPIPMPDQLQAYKLDPYVLVVFLQNLEGHMKNHDTPLRALFARAALLLLAEQNLWEVLGSDEKSNLLAWV